MEIRKQDIGDLKFNDEILRELKLSYYEAVSLITFHVFIIEINDEKTLKKTWSKVYNSIAFYIHDKFENTFEKWNLYLFYVINSDCSIPLKYEIENNPFSSRKIVIENNRASKKCHEQIIGNYIFDLDIELNNKEKLQLQEFKQDGRIFKLIESPQIELSVDGRNRDKHVETIYEEILKIYKNEI
jgi:hypothetical protein